MLETLRRTGHGAAYAIIGLAVYSGTYAVTGGLKAVALTDVIQVLALILGGFVATYMVLDEIGGGVISGLSTMIAKAPEKFDMILDKSNPEYMNLPGISVLIGGMWIANLYYWGTNQYIIQKSLASKSLDEAQSGTAVAAIIKIILPLIVVIPGIAAYVLKADIGKSDEAYPWVVSNYVGSGFKGIAIAALIAAIGSSVAAIVNSASTIFSLDVYRPLFMKNDVERDQSLSSLENNSTILTVKEERKLIRVGKTSGLIFLFIGVLIAPSLGSLGQAFQYIQEYTGFISPGVLAIFMLGLEDATRRSNPDVSTSRGRYPGVEALAMFSEMRRWRSLSWSSRARSKPKKGVLARSIVCSGHPTQGLQTLPSRPQRG